RWQLHDAAQAPAERRYGVARVERVAPRWGFAPGRFAAERSVAVEVIGRVLGLRRWPFTLPAPVPAVVELALGRAPAGAAAHDEDPDWRLALHAVGHVLEPAVEPAQLLLEVVPHA